MSEEERKEKRKSPRTLSIIALLAGIATFLFGLLILPYTFCDTLVSRADVITILLLDVALYATIVFWPIAAIGLVLSIATLFIERNVLFRLLPLAFVLVGILLFAVCYAYLWFTLDMLWG